MRKFVRKIIYFILSVIVLAFVFDFIISEILKHSHEYEGEYEVINDIYDGSADCDVAIYGSSRAWVHIDPKIIKDSLNLSTYNFGIDGHGFWLQYLRHLELLKYGIKPKIIIVSTDVFSLEKRKGLYNKEQFLPYMLWNKNIKEYTSSYIGFKEMDYYLPMVRYFGKKSALKSCFMLLKKENHTNRRRRGFIKQDITWVYDFEKVEKQLKSFRIKIDASTVHLFEQFLIECKKSKTEVILVNAPEYFEAQKFVQNRTEVIKIYNALAAKYNLLFLDYSKSNICKNQDLFYNATHMNAQGSNMFSKELASDIKNRRSFMLLKRR